MKNVVIFSRHFGLSKRKAGFHYLADNLKKEYKVFFITVDFSSLSIFANDYRNSINERYINSSIEEEGFTCYLRKTLWFPIGINKIIDFFSKSLVVLYPFIFFNKEIKNQVKKAKVIIIESSNALLFLKKIRKLNNNVKIIYRVSDLVPWLRHVHKLLVKADNNIGKYCDEVSTVTSYIYEYYKNKISSDKLFLDCHGIDKNIFDSCLSNPYSDLNKNKVVFVGASKIDIEGLNKIVELNPSYEFYYFGPLVGIKNRKNVKCFGEKKFQDIVPYIKYANFGLQFVKDKSIKEYGDSLKVLQYTYCNLPIIAPEGIITNRDNFTFYNQNDYSTLKNIFSRVKPVSKDLSKQVEDWNTVANRIIDRVL